MGDAGIRVVGVLWLIGALAFLVAGIAVATGMGWAGRFMLGSVIASALLCVAGWPDARLGLVVNLGLAFVIVFGARLHPALPSP